MVSPTARNVASPLPTAGTTVNRDRKDWVRDAKCVPYPALFTTNETKSSTLACKSICNACPVLAECLGYALAHDVKGIWAGTNTNQRTKMQVDRRLLLATVPLEPELSEYLKEEIPTETVRLIQKPKKVSLPPVGVAPVVILKKPVQGIQWDDLDQLLHELQSFS